VIVKANNPQAIGLAARVVRRAQKIRQDDMAATLGVSHVFVRNVEKGKSGVQLGKVMELLDELGIRVMLDIPEGLDEAGLAALVAATQEER